ncbi:hypothetical protein D3C76_1758980 [compost metagenome]
MRGDFRRERVVESFAVAAGVGHLGRGCLSVVVRLGGVSHRVQPPIGAGNGRGAEAESLAAGGDHAGGNLA